MFFTLLQNGAVLGVEENLENMWKQGMQSYSDKRWQEAIESIKTHNAKKTSKILIAGFSRVPCAQYYCQGGDRARASAGPG